MCRTDLYFLLRVALGRDDIEHPWIFKRCREVQNNPNGYLDLWAREHYKSTIITYAQSIQDILSSHGDNPLERWNGREVTIGIFSHTRPIAKGFLRQIKQEFETNDQLVKWFPDILWAEPKKSAHKWSEDDGIVVKRSSNPKESTVEAWGLVDGQPTSKHFYIRAYDDVVTKESVGSPEMMKKTVEAWELSLNLGVQGGIERYIGTRYHALDAYREILAREAAIPRKHPGTLDGTTEGTPVYWTKEYMAEKRRKMGPYTFGCFTGDMKVLRSDWTEQCISSVQVGDEVVGYGFWEIRARLVSTKVVAIQVRKKPIVKITFQSGRFLYCTEDHKFWSGRVGRGYAPLSCGRKHGRLHGACSVYDPRPVRRLKLSFEAGYIAAMIDGEGGISGSTVHITQCENTHPEVCRRIEQALNSLGIKWNVHKPKSKPGINDYYITGGRQSHILLAKLLKDCGKAEVLSTMLFNQGTRNFGKGTKDVVVSIEECGEADVYNIQTETGNYVCEGYAVKNCQILQDPVADKVQGFKEEWLRHYSKPGNHERMNKVIIVDPANEKKKKSDYTSMIVVGLAEDRNYYLLDIVRDRLNLKERTSKLFFLHRKWSTKKSKKIKTFYEKYGKDSDIEHIESEMDNEGYHFDIIPVGGPMDKLDRIRRLIPDFSDGRWWLPKTLMYVDYEGTSRDMVQVFIEEEYKIFPVGEHEDVFDSMARVKDKEFDVDFPKPPEHVLAKTKKKKVLRTQNAGTGWLGN